MLKLWLEFSLNDFRHNLALRPRSSWGLKLFNIDTVLLRQARWREKGKTSCNEHNQPAVWQRRE